MKKENYTAGFARLDITPPLGTEIGGYFDVRVTKGVLDPLDVNAVAFGGDGRSAVVIVCDLLNMRGEVGFEWPERIAADLGLEPGSVLIHCTHTHTSPVVGPNNGNNDPMYDDWLYRRLHDAAQMAMDDRKPVIDVQWAEGEVPGQAFVRRYYMKDGTVVTNPKNADPNIDRPTCDTDDSLRLVRILREGGREIALVNFQNHPDCIGGEYISGDWAGQARRSLEAKRDVHCVLLNGTQGNLNNNNKFLPKIPASHAKAMALGDELGEKAAALFDRTVSTGMTGLSYNRGAVELKTKRDPSRVPEAQRIVDLFKAGRTEEIHPTRKMANYLYCEANHLCRLEREKMDYMHVPVCTLTFCGLGIAGFPGEPFCNVGKQVRAASPFPVTFACCLTNGALVYFPMAEDYDLGGYEVYNSPLVQGSTERMTELACRLLSEL
ncbi:MAG: hypothetical protein IJP02_03885 [Oscillospiraceae bacterium]|nr:hypothetical protein [Oscillospiraceae bacterium]